MYPNRYMKIKICLSKSSNMTYIWLIFLFASFGHSAMCRNASVKCRVKNEQKMGPYRYYVLCMYLVYLFISSTYVINICTYLNDIINKIILRHICLNFFHIGSFFKISQNVRFTLKNQRLLKKNDGECL